MGLLPALVHAVGRCCDRISTCFIECFRDLASTTKGYVRDKTLGGGLDTSHLASYPSTEGLYADSIEYVPSGYKALSAVLGSLRLTTDDVFIDYGCGKGRVLFAVAKYPLRKVIGIELDPNLAELARHNAQIFARTNRPSAVIDIVHSDATAFDPKEGTIFYMFNPFGEETMRHVLENIRASLITYPRSIRILYNNPKHRAILDTQDWLAAEGEIGNSLVYIWRNRPLFVSHTNHSTEGIAELV